MILGIWIALSALVSAAQLRIDADARDLQVGQAVDVHLTLVDGAVTQPPALPEVEGMQFTFKGTRQSSVFQMGRSARTLTFSYQARALTQGDKTIPPIRMEVGGELLESQELTLSVSPRELADGPVALTGGFSASDAWVGQVLIYELDFQTTERVLDRRWTPPAFEGLLEVPGVDAGLREYATEIDGQEYSRLELRAPMIASSAGRRTVPPSVLTIQIPVARSANRRRPLGFGFVDVRDEVFATRPSELSVRPLPEAGQSANWTGLVGKFELAAALSDRKVAVGESVTLTVRLKGDGNLSAFTLPPAPTDAGFRAYDDAPELEARMTRDGFRAQALFKRAIVPEGEGTVTIEPFVLQVFDPEAGAYVELKTRPLTLKVDAGETRGTLQSFSGAEEQPTVESVAEDILPFRPGARGGGVFSPTHPVVLGVAGLPWLGALGLWLSGLAGRRREQTGPDRLGPLRARLAGIASADLAELEDLYRDALGFRMEREAGDIVRSDVRAFFGDERGPALEALYADLESARYAGEATADLGSRVKEQVTWLLR